MEQTTAIEHMKRQLAAVLNPEGTPAERRWQLETGEQLTLDEALAQVSIRLPAAFILYGGFTTVTDETSEGGRIKRLERRINVYLLKLGDMWPEVEAIIHHMNARLHRGALANNEFWDFRGELRTLSILAGDGIRLQLEGAPAFEILIAVQ